MISALKVPAPYHLETEAEAAGASIPSRRRRACGFALARGRHDTRAIQEWLGHRNIQHTTQ